MKSHMTRLQSTSDARVTGAAMDLPLPPRRRRRLAIAAASLAALLGLGAAVWALAPRGLQVPAANIRLATVAQGMFRDDMALRATVAPLNSVMLDAVESGRVEQVFARDGALVEQGAVLFRLSNPQRRLDLLAREAEHAQQISNLTNLRVALEASRMARQRRGDDLAFAMLQAEKQYRRNAQLAQQGFLSAAALEESADRLAHQRRVFDSDRQGSTLEADTQRDAVTQMERAIARIEAGLRLAGATIDALAVRAPVGGRLAEFRLQVGQTVRPDQHLGRIDDVARFKLSAQVDEYYLHRVSAGQRGTATFNGAAHAVTVSRIYPQVSEGRFAVELAFDEGKTRALHPGQGLEVLMTLGGATQALLLPNDAFINDSGGAWVFVVDAGGTSARRREIRTGRRNNSQVEVLSGLAAGERVLVSSYAAYANARRLQFSD